MLLPKNHHLAANSGRKLDIIPSAKAKKGSPTGRKRSYLSVGPIRCLCPVLQKRHVVIMDNVAFHQVWGVKEAIESTGVKLIYLPPYSPDLNPIEQMWGKVKNYLRKESARTLDKFAISIKLAFMSIQSADLSNWYGHCGYRSL